MRQFVLLSWLTLIFLDVYRHTTGLLEAGIKGAPECANQPEHQVELEGTASSGSAPED